MDIDQSYVFSSAERAGALGRLDDRMGAPLHCIRDFTGFFWSYRLIYARHRKQWILDGSPFLGIRLVSLAQPQRAMS